MGAQEKLKPRSKTMAATRQNYYETQDQIDALEKEIKSLNAKEHLIATNEGTYSAVEAGRKCGTGDPAFANRHEYETVGGDTRSTGPDKADMPGRLRRMDTTELQEDRRRVKELRSQVSNLRKSLQD
jgi:polyhydroxyalkanoate synthesis regulator phasin